jgi:hypothetical protein
MLLVPDDTDITPDDFAEAVLADRTMFMSGEREQLASHAGRLDAKGVRGVVRTTQKARAADEKGYSQPKQSFGFPSDWPKGKSAPCGTSMTGTCLPSGLG